MNKGYIYIMTNPCLHDMVKIGYAIDVEERKKQLSTTALPYEYEVYATYETSGKLEDKKLHKLNELDFKLFLSTSEGKSRKELIRNHRNDYFDFYDLGEVIKDKTAEELESIANMNSPSNKYNAEQISIVKHFLKKCRTNKNLLFFAPRYFYADTTDEILDYFNNVVVGAMEYREKHIAKDTYFGWIQSFKGIDDLYEWDGRGNLMRVTNLSFVLAKYDERKNKLKIVDVVAIRKSKYFLRHHVNYFEYSHQMFW